MDFKYTHFREKKKADFEEVVTLFPTLHFSPHINFMSILFV